MSALNETVETLAVREFRLVDENGSLRGLWTSRLGGGMPILQLFDKHQLARLSLMVDDDESCSVAILDKSGQTIFGIGQSSEGWVELNVFDVDGCPRVMIRVAADGLPTIRCYDASGKLIFQMP